MFHVTVNGHEMTCAPGQTILSFLRGTPHAVPSLCDDPRLQPIGGCRLCLVQLAGHDRPVAACTTAVAGGLEIITHTAQIESLRRTQLRLLARHYPRQAPTAGRLSPFEELLQAYGLESEAGDDPLSIAVDDSHPCIHVDMARCIQCFRCVRICEEQAGRFIWRAWNRGDRTEIRPADGGRLGDSECVSCGACVDTCPSGALVDKGAFDASGPVTEVRTVCSYCGTGCELLAGVQGGRVVSARPVVEAPVNRGHLCVKGRYGFDFVHAPDRVTQPMVRGATGWTVVSWNEAIALVVEKLRGIRDRFGADAVGVLGSARATNEENYVAQKFARVVLGTNNVDCCARVCHAPTAAGMKLMLGTGAATNSFDDIEQARTILVLGANPRENHPIVGDRIVQAVRRGAELHVIDPRRTELASHARLHLQPRPGTNIPLLNALAHTIVAERLYDPAAVAHCENWDAFAGFIAAFSPESVAEICGVPAESIREVARRYAIRRPAMCFHGLGVTEHVQGTEGVMCLVNLALLTGNIGRPGTGVNPLRGQNNVQGAAHMGCDPALLPGSAPLAENRERFEATWKKSIPTRPGLSLMQMLDAASQGSFRALWAMGYDVGLTNPHAQSTLAALESLELVVVQDLFLTQTAQRAGTVFLPACSAFEKDGTFMNSERRIQRVRQALSPLGESQSDWRIICQIAAAMGHRESFNYDSAQEIWNEVREVWPGGAGISYERLESSGLQWPCPSEDHPGTAILHRQIFDCEERHSLRLVEYAPTPEVVSTEFPFLLTTGRALYQFNAGTMSNRSRAAQFQPTDVLHVAPDDARRLDLVDGQRVVLNSRHGQVVIEVLISDSVKPGELFTTFHSSDVFVNRLTSRHRDGFTHTPEYKVTAVQIEPIRAPTAE